MSQIHTLTADPRPCTLQTADLIKHFFNALRYQTTNKDLYKPETFAKMAQTNDPLKVFIYPS